MKIVEVRLQRYDLELIKPITIKGNAIRKRSGLILSIIDSTGRVGYGEVSPLPFLHVETIEEAVLCVSGIRKTIIGINLSDILKPLSNPIEKRIGVNLPPSVLFGIETALFDLYLQQTDSQMLSGLKVPVCGLTGTASESFYDDLKKMLQRGYATVKIKVGAHSIAEDVSRIKAAKEIIQDKMIVRLDANRAWTLDDALAFCEQTGSERIEYLEEPVKNVFEQKAFADRSDIPLALDETLLEERIDSASNLGDIGAFVIKPGLAGGVRRSSELIEIARRNHITPVLSSSFQSGLAIRSLYLFAGVMGLSDIPAGFDTLKWFTEDCLIHQIPVLNGFVHLQQLLEQRPYFKEALLTDVK